MDLPLRADIFQAGRRYIRLAPQTRLATAIVDVDGSDVNLILGAGSVMGEAITTPLANCFAGAFVETATGDQLDRIAADRYGIARQDATPSTVVLTLTRPNTLGGGGTISRGTRVQTPDGLQFGVDLDNLVLPSMTTLGVTATCLTSGPDTNAPAGAITQLVDTLFDPTFTVTNAAPAAGGRDRDDDATFKGKIKGYFATIRRGTLSAINFAALDTPGVAVSTAYEILNPANQFPAAAVQLIVADDAGNFSPTMLQAVRDQLLQFRALGIPVLVAGGVVAYEPIVWDLDYEVGIDTVTAQSNVQAVTVALGQFLAPNETLHRSSLIAAARTVPGVIVRANSLVAPVGDVVPTDPTQLIRMRPTDVTFT